MNRIVLIGNGFDLAHGLKTSYQDFIKWYREQKVQSFNGNLTRFSKDPLFSIESKEEVFNVIAFTSGINFDKTRRIKLLETIEKDKEKFKVSYSPFYDKIRNSIEQKGWVDIENEYYNVLKLLVEKDSTNDIKTLNKQLEYLKQQLIKYLEELDYNRITISNDIKKLLYSPILYEDIAVSANKKVRNYIDTNVKMNNLPEKLQRYGYDVSKYIEVISYTNKEYGNSITKYTDVPQEYMLPDSIMIVNFNYTNTARFYYDENLSLYTNIHGTLDQPNEIIFGYDNELDDNYNGVMRYDDNESRKNLKSMRYSESNNYRNVLAFIEAEPYQVYIMGLSCGDSDRTLLNMLFEHPNCISVKPFYHKEDDGSDDYVILHQNIARSFTNAKRMRDIVVNKTYCEPLPQSPINQQPNQ